MVELTRKQFDVLTWIENRKDTPYTLKELSDCINWPLDEVHKVLLELNALESIKNGIITEKGLCLLEPYRAKRAIFLAAGFGSRLAPITCHTPKPLIRVHGKRIIDSLLDAVLAAGIDDIVIVRGHLGEQFVQLLDKYPMLKFYENPVYNDTNNISSALLVRHLFRQAYCLESDILLRNPAVISKYQYCSNYAGVAMDFTDDWCMQLAENKITEVTIGGHGGARLYGISYWDLHAGNLLEKQIEAAYMMPGGHAIYWDTVALKLFFEQYRIEARLFSQDDFVEIDTYDELRQLDESYPSFYV